MLYGVGAGVDSVSAGDSVVVVVGISTVDEGVVVGDGEAFLVAAFFGEADGEAEVEVEVSSVVLFFFAVEVVAVALVPVLCVLVFLAVADVS